MPNFNYEWWSIKIKCRTGVYTWEFKGKNKENVAKQIRKCEKTDDSILEIYWDTLTLDRIGYQRLS